MADWQRTLDISEDWEKAQEHELAPQELALIIVEKLNNLQNFNDSVIDGIKSYLIEQFKTLADNEDADEDYFNELMRQLYNWGDISLDNKFAGKKVCFIKTF